MIRLPPEDVMDIALRRKGEVPLEIERSDGHRSGSDLQWWLRCPDAPPPKDIDALKLVAEGPVLDVGCATGRHMELLCARGIESVGIDICPTAILLAHNSGQIVENRNAWDLPAEPQYATIMLLGGNIGIAGTLDRLQSFLSIFATALRREGSIVISTIDWRKSASSHKEFVNMQHQVGRYPGEVRLRLCFADVISEWFPWLWVDREKLVSVATDIGLCLKDILVWGNHYVAHFVKKG